MTRAEQDLLSNAALMSFRLAGQFLDLADRLARPAGITATKWQVLGAVLDGPLTVSDIARAMGITRQAVQRTADLLVADGLAEHRDNPAHRRAKLVVLTAAGRATMAAISPQHADAAHRLAVAFGAERLNAAVAVLTALSSTMDELDADSPKATVRDTTSS